MGPSIIDEMIKRIDFYFTRISLESHMSHRSQYDIHSTFRYIYLSAESDCGVDCCFSSRNLDREHIEHTKRFMEGERETYLSNSFYS